MGTVVIREYEQRFIAEEAVGLLEDAGIAAMLSSDDVGGSYPQLGFAGGYRVMVNEKLTEEAEEVLKVLGEYTPPENSGLFS